MCLHSCLHAGASETERRLHQKLFENYNMKVRPARYWEDKVTVRVGMTLSQLVSLVNEQHKQCANMPSDMQTKYSTSYQLRIGLALYVPVETKFLAISNPKILQHNK